MMSQSQSGPVSRSGGEDTTRWVSDLAWVSLAALVFFFLLLGSRPLSNPDEGRYSEIPREMAATGDYVTPRLNGVKYFEKPPLLYWLQAATFEAVGVNEWSARSWVAILAAAGVVITYAGARRMYGRETGIAAAIVLATSLLYYALSRIILLDLVVSVFIAGALFSFYAALTFPAGKERRLLWYGFYVSMALAVLAKGLIGFVLPGAVAFFWVLLLNRWRDLRPFYPITGALLLLAIAAPWHVLATQANHDFFDFYFIHEHWERFFSKVHDRYQPPYFFVPVFLLGLFPWIAFFPAACSESLRGGWKARKENALAWFLLLWIVLIFLFFSKSQSKLIPYILPVFPAAAALLGNKLVKIWKGTSEKGAKAGLWGVSIFCVLLGLALLFYPVPKATPEMKAALFPLRLLLSSVLLLTGATVSHFAHRNRFRPSLVSLVAGMAVFLVSLNPIGGIVDKRSTKELALTLKARIQSSDAVYAVGDYFQDLPVYLGRTVSVVGYSGELNFGIAAEPDKTAPRFLSRDEFIRRWSTPGTAYAVMEREELEKRLKDYPFKYSILAENRAGILLTNVSP